MNTLLNRSPNKAEVLELVQFLAQPYPDSAEAQFAVAQAAWIANKDDTALAAINQGRTLAETDPRAAISRGIAAMARELSRSAAVEPDCAQGGSLWARLRNLPLSRGLARRQA